MKYFSCLYISYFDFRLELFLFTGTSTSALDVWIQWNGIVEWTGMVEWNVDKLDGLNGL